MPIAASARIHPTALIDPAAEIGADVEVGPFVVIDGPVHVGPGCVIRARATLCGQLALGRGNDVGIGAVLGERAQHLTYTGTEDTRTEIGDGNVFREYVTVNRGTPATGSTVIGNNNFFMANAHVAHDCRVGNHIVMANAALLGGHCEVFDRAFLSGGCAIQQFGRIGRLAFFSGLSSCTKDILPFMVLIERDRYAGINKVGMQRAGMTAQETTVIRQAYRILFRSGLVQKLAIQRLETELGMHPPVAELLEFIHSSKRGFNSSHHSAGNADVEAA